MPDRFRELVAGSRDVCAIVDSSGSITYVSPAIQTTLGLIPAAVVGSVLWELVHPDDVVRVHDTLRDVLAIGDRQRLEFEMLDVSGHWRRFDASMLVIDAPTPLAGLVATDITERRAMDAVLRDRDEQLGQARKMEVIGRLASGISHDFGNLLTIIIGATGRMLDSLPKDTQLRTDAESIHVAAERAATIVQQLLGVGRRGASAPVVLDLNDVVRTAEQLLNRLVGEHIRLETVSGGGLWPVKADRAQIEQVLLNLAANARDAMPRGGRLTIETRNIPDDARVDGRIGACVAVTVTDTGVGMDPATQAQAFEPFFTTKAVGHGTGLGLANVHAIIKEHGGWTDLVSTPGRGAAVTFALPRARDAKVPTASQASPPVGGSETILLVEDEDGVRTLVRDMLRQVGYEVLEAGAPSEAEQISKAFDRGIALLLTDVVMPEMSGLDLSIRLRAQRPQLQVMYMSGFPEPTVGDGFAEAPGAHFLAKPFDRQGLLRAVRRALSA